MSQLMFAPVLHVLLGIIVFVANILLLIITVSDRKLRTGVYYLIANLWFANCILGIAMITDNVVVGDDGNEPLASSEGTAALINCIGNLATLLALSTHRLVRHRCSTTTMSAWTALRIGLCIWISIGILLLAKSAAFAFASTICYRCLFGFESAILITFASANLIFYIASIYTTISRVSTTIHIGGDASCTDVGRDRHDVLTTGLWLLLHLVSFGLLVMLLVANTVWDGEQSTDYSVKLLLAAYSLHAIANPMVAVLRDSELGSSLYRTCFVHAHRHNNNHHSSGMMLFAGVGGDPPPPYIESAMTDQ